MKQGGKRLIINFTVTHIDCFKIDYLVYYIAER